MFWQSPTAAGGWKCWLGRLQQPNPGCWASPSFPVGLGGKVERHHAVENAPYCQGHGGAVEQPVGVAALEVNGNAVRRLPGESRQRQGHGRGKQPPGLDFRDSEAASC